MWKVIYLFGFILIALASAQNETVSSSISERSCSGECIEVGILTVLCDDIDTEASCPRNEICCIEGELDSTSTTVTEKAETTETSTPATSTSCSGECVPGLISLLCDDVDSNGHCSDEQVCCIVKDGSNPATTAEIETSTEKEIEETSEAARSCDGECIGGLYALFCDDVDAEAECSNNDVCCVISLSKALPSTNPEMATESTMGSRVAEAKALPTETTDSPETTPEITEAVSTTTEIVKSTTVDQVAIQECPGYCMAITMRPTCGAPSVLIENTSSCLNGTVCCDNTKQEPTQSTSPQTTSSTTPAPVEKDACPGSCIVSSLNATCKDEITDKFQCDKSGSVCCAPILKIGELQTMKPNDLFSTLPPNTTPISLNNASLFNVTTVQPTQPQLNP